MPALKIEYHISVVASFSHAVKVEFIYLWLCNPCGPWPLFQFHNQYTVGRTPWMGDQIVATQTNMRAKTNKQTHKQRNIQEKGKIS
jgi:hypothetical protein